ncbi:MAG TPA: dual specificity protein phosphatase [Marmoricola sp.]|nr:dual specificity protein phosphatase [Marmoricola sp.]
MSDLPLLSSANAHFVTDTLLIGGDLDYRSRELAAEQVMELHEAGVTHIIDVRVEWSDQDWVVELLPGLEYFHHGIDDAGQAVPAQWFQAGVDYAIEALESGGVVLTHCHMGINRGPSLGFAVLLALGWDAVGALDAIRRVRPIAFIAYAEDALRWHHRREPAALDRDLRRLEEWRHDHDLDVESVIRLKRQQGE